MADQDEDFAAMLAESERDKPRAEEAAPHRRRHQGQGDLDRQGRGVRRRRRQGRGRARARPGQRQGGQAARQDRRRRRGARRRRRRRRARRCASSSAAAAPRRARSCSRRRSSGSRSRASSPRSSRAASRSTSPACAGSARPRRSTRASSTTSRRLRRPEADVPDHALRAAQPRAVAARAASRRRTRSSRSRRARSSCPGAVLRGKVVGFKPFGAFVDIGGIEGMLHVSELGYARVEQARGRAAPRPGGRRRGAQDRARRARAIAISLSLKALASDPWRDATANLAEGPRVKGKITRLQPFGAFVEIAPGVEGLVHISELGAGRRINHPKEVVVGRPGGRGDRARDRSRAPPDRRCRSPRRRTARAEDVAAARRRSAPAKLGTFGDLLRSSRSSARRSSGAAAAADTRAAADRLCWPHA